MSGVRVLYDAKVRWQQGREAHGNGQWIGREPVEELYEELLDGLNYIEEHIRRHGHSPWVDRVRELVLEAATGVRVNGLE